MRIIRDLIATFFFELLMFVMAICGTIILGVLMLSYVASAALLFVSVVSGIIYLNNHSAHMLTLSIVYFGYSAVAFTIPMVVARVPQIIDEALKRRRQERLSMERIGGLRIASDVSFHNGAR